MNAIALLSASSIVVARLLAPSFDVAPGPACAPGQLAVSRPLVLRMETAWPWRPLTDTVRVAPGDTLDWRRAVPEPANTLYLLRLWAEDAGGRSCTTWILRRSVPDLAAPAGLRVE